MASAAQTLALPQSLQSSGPYLTVGLDERGSTCWQVISSDLRICCCSGVRALEVLQAVCRSKYSSVPQQ